MVRKAKVPKAPKEVLGIGIAGVLEAPGFNHPERTRLHARVVLEYVGRKESFAKEGGEPDIVHSLALDLKTFVVDEVEEPVVQESLPAYTDE